MAAWRRLVFRLRQSCDFDHDGGYFTLYAHLSETLVAINDQVTVGDEIGKVGDTRISQR
ncbi:MAG: M23 family metallopeptidase [Bdellovibrionota bacterium]